MIFSKGIMTSISEHDNLMYSLTIASGSTLAGISSLEEAGVGGAVSMSTLGKCCKERKNENTTTVSKML